jgi:multimeric flavodoxin WrbA
MKIVVLSGSPRPSGNSNALVSAFTRGAEAAGHEVIYFDAGKMDVHPCVACEGCRIPGATTCVVKDDMQQIYPALLAADMVVLATPLYYFGFAAQLKAVIDRFYAHNLALRGKRSVLLMACGDTADWVPQALVAHYETLCLYCQWQDAGRVLALGQYNLGDIDASDYLAQAEALGKSV